jgi:hypothetical protein
MTLSESLRDLEKKRKAKGVESSREKKQKKFRLVKIKINCAEDSVLRTEMTGLESQKEDVPKRIFFFKPMSWLG